MLIIGHGTRFSAGAAQFHAFVERIRHTVNGEYQVGGGFLELSRPTIAEAIDTLLDGQSPRHVVAIPLLLLAAGHSKNDIPQALQREAERHPDVTFSYGRPLGPHPTLITALDERIDEVLTKQLSGASRQGTVVVLAGQGSTDPEGNADLAKVARLLWEGRGYDGVETAYLSTTTPGLPAVLDRVLTLGAQRIVVAQHLLFSGVLSDRVHTVTVEWAARHPHVAVAVASLLGDCQKLPDLVVDRYNETIHGNIGISPVSYL